MKLNIGLFGGDGKMGQAVVQMLAGKKTQNKLVPFFYVGKKKPELFTHSSPDLDSAKSKKVDVWIDFSSPEGLGRLLQHIANTDAAVVSGTTGLSERDFNLLKQRAKSKKIFWASNMSPGLWAFRQALKGFGSINDFDFAIEEIHHIHKKDKPSGTAKTIHKDLESVVNKKIDPPVSYRLGGVFGIHTVFAASANEVITMQHQALNRSVFAEGAIMAADWIVNQKSGLYTMDDMLIKSKAKREKK